MVRHGLCQHQGGTSMSEVCYDYNLNTNYNHYNTNYNDNNPNYNNYGRFCL